MDRRPTEQPRPVPRAGRGAPASLAKTASAAHARSFYVAIADERRERFAELRRGGFTIREAAWDLGVCHRTAERYEAHRRRAQQGAPQT